jgi:hypothetical protein
MSMVRCSQAQWLQLLVLDFNVLTFTDLVALDDLIVIDRLAGLERGHVITFGTRPSRRGLTLRRGAESAAATRLSAVGGKLTAGGRTFSAASATWSGCMA